MFSIKKGVKIDKLKPQMVLANQIVLSAYMSCGYCCRVTSGNDGKHKTGSKHYTGEALDYGIKYWTTNGEEKFIPKPDLMKIYDTIKRNCGDNFDVILETNHIHIEYDPK